MTRAELAPFLQKHRLGVQSTVSASGDPQAAVVGIAITPELEIVFDTLDTTRKCRNLRANPRIAFVIGWDQEITVQLEGIADEPTGAERERILEVYFLAYPDGRDRLAWKGITHFRVRPTWIRYSNFNVGGEIVEIQV
ncbi:MAG: pyridoxamine 5'-phosphate oxidase family protein [Acidobacteriia bacterium]|nr:pyridoxamine 5'-phosphate oxidase family protein [Terriglobia bacterium]